MPLDILCGALFCISPDLADHDNRVGLSVLFKHLQEVNKVCPIDRVSADSDACRLPKTGLCDLPDRLIGKGSAPRYHADPPFFMDKARHDPDLALLRVDDPGAVRPYEPALFSCHEPFGLDHIHHRDPLGNTDDQGDLRLYRFHDGICGKWRRDKDHRDIGPCRIHSLPDCIEYRDALKLSPALAGSDPGHNIGPILHAGTGMERTLLTRNPLHHQPCRFINENTHPDTLSRFISFYLPFTNLTTFCAPSQISEAT